jgi:zinc protease
MRTERLLAIAVLGVGLSGLLGGNCAAQEPAARGTGAAVMPVTTTAKVAAPPGSAPDAVLPTTKALLARNDEVMGGAEAISKASSRRMKGLYQTEDGSSFFSIEIFQKAPNKSLFKITLPNGVVVRDVCDGQSAWVEDAGGGYHQYEGAALASRLRYAEFADRGKAFLLAATGKVTGQEKIGRHNTYVVEYTPEKNVVSRMYFDVDSGYIVHTEDMYSTKDGPYSVKLDLDDYRDVAGLKVPYRMKRQEKGVVLNIRLVQVEVNAPIDDSIFLKPESAPK